MFFMQSASFWPTSARWKKATVAPIAGRCSASAEIPSDNYIRDFLDRADPALLQPVSERMEALLSEPPMRQAFGRLGGRTLIALDGTEFFCSQKLGCPHCLTRKRAPNGKTESYHSMLSATVVAPGHSKVVPLMPEFVATQDGAEKQDAANATLSGAGSPNMARGWRRCAPCSPRRRSVRLPPRCQDDHGCRRRLHLHLQADFPQDKLYGFIDGAEFRRHEEKVRRRNTKETLRYRWN